MPLDLQTVVADLADRLEKPVAVNDFDLNLLAASAQDLNVDQYRVESILRRRTPGPVVRMLHEKGMLTRADPFVLEGGLLPGLRPRMCIPIEANGRNIAFLWIVLKSESGLTTTEYSYARAAAEDIRNALLASIAPGIDILVAQSRHLQRLIHPDTVTAGYAVAELVSQHTIEPFRRLVVSVLELEETLPPEAAGERIDLSQVVAPALRALAQPTLLGIVDGAIVLVSNDAKHRALVDRIEAALERAPSHIRVRAIGSSQTLDWKDGLRDVYLEAAYAARIAGRVPEAPRRTDYDSLGALVVFRHLPWTQRSVEEISADAAALLAEGRTVNSETLLAYLRWAGDTQRTCAELSIHRTTLYYRLDRCRGHIGDALEDGWRRTSLYLALVLWDLAGLGGQH
jgi:hypothetical protein